jgi:hypothetical protein
MFHSWTIKDLRKTFGSFSKTKASRFFEPESPSPTKDKGSGHLSHRQQQ